MSVNSGKPIIGRLASAGLGFLSSTCGCPVAGLVGSRSHTTTPQRASPHLLMRTRASPAWVSQTPTGLPAPCAWASDAANTAANTAIVRQVLGMMRISLGEEAALAKSRIGENAARSFAPAGQLHRRGGRQPEHHHRTRDQRE